MTAFDRLAAIAGVGPEAAESVAGGRLCRDCRRRTERYRSARWHPGMPVYRGRGLCDCCTKRRTRRGVPLPDLIEPAKSFTYHRDSRLPGFRFKPLGDCAVCHEQMATKRAVATGHPGRIHAAHGICRRCAANTYNKTKRRKRAKDGSKRPQ
ncbi:hypothetical protein D5S18_03105 [Nocardia panacis]|uniref:Uncharacterized protein n=1 Tax=Nocardia panacis TaxID=2340916 RepID=A0A3A4KZF0_9NOCA|nr:hypothetical protein [Nocardia panacis]RJO79334.1 hypothetical protein D5S18_03105 [Nocardia panacis]